ncbi:hypothetical protein COCNU_06G018360 [Cocos nucifera]|uniref:Uncharacterized protein n=1 Tax=Cocos nucifera TaxID=13894 RepID=A0A8K0N4D8_COCNU|nr:hypothetical protein COCNU_06G018360 [Cocos nucifera]
MDAQATEMLTKELYTKKRKEKVQNDSSKRVKVDISSSEVLASIAATSEIIVGTETILTTKIGIAGVGPVPSMPSGPSDEDQVLELLIKKGTGEGRKKKAIAKTSCKACLGGLDGDDNERGEDSFDNPEVIQDLIDRFAKPEVVDQMADLDPWQLVWGSLGTILKSNHQMLAHIKRACRQEAEAQKAQEDLQAEIHHLQERVDEVEHLAEKKMTNIESL